MPTFKLIYFDGRGVAERTRLLFKIAKIDFEDVRYSREEMTQRKEAGEFAVAMGKLPILEVDGVQLSQSKAIERFVARQLGLMGSSPMEEAQIDAVCEHQRDVREAYGKVDGKPEAPEWFEKDFPEALAKFEKALPASPGPFLMGPTLTLADLAWFQFLIEFLDRPEEVEAVSKVLPSMPRLKAAMDGVLSNPEIAAWRESRPKGMF